VLAWDVLTDLLNPTYGRRCIVMTYLLIALAIAAVAYMFMKNK